MRIAVIGSKGLPAKQGGIEHHCKEIYARLVAEGHSVDLFARQSYVDADLRQPYCHAGIRVIPLPSLKRRGLDALANSALGALCCLGSRYDVVHFHAIGPALFSWLPRLFSSAKVVVTCHGLDWSRAKWGSFSTLLLRCGEWIAAHVADRVIVVSRDLQTYFAQTYDHDTTYVLNAPASYAASDPSFAYVRSLGLTPKRYLVFLGRLVPEKRPDLLIQAFQALNSPDWHLVLVGGSSDTSGFTTTLVDLASGNGNIVFAGEQSGRYLAELVRGAGVFVLPSDLEGLPLALLEAMREGIPILASDIPVHRELLGDDRGLLFAAGNLDSCQRQLAWALRHPQSLATMAIAGQEYIQRHF